jgi:hypothetical protein
VLSGRRDDVKRERSGWQIPASSAAPLKPKRVRRSLA